MTAPAPDPAPAPAATSATLTRGDLAQVFLRSFLFQSLWSRQRMQNVGWLFSLWPVFRRLQTDHAERARAAVAHAEYFNTHPYTADIILGVAAELEERRAKDPTTPREAVTAAKRAMAGPLSALGETVFWLTLRPLLLVAAVAAAAGAARASWWLTPVLYLAVFNLVHVGVKAGGLWMGYRRGLTVAALLVRWPVQVWAARACWAGLGLSLGALAVAVARSAHPGPAAAAAAGVFFLLRRSGAPQAAPLVAAAAGAFTLFRG